MQSRDFEVRLRPVTGVPNELHGEHDYTRAMEVFSSGTERYVHLNAAPRDESCSHPSCQQAHSSAAAAPRGALLYPRLSREELEGRFLGLMADLDGKPEGDNSMPGK